jgi:hypothetical protein
MEQTSLPGHVQVSHSTANELIEAFKERWLVPREDKVAIHKGKNGDLEGGKKIQTFWLLIDVDRPKTVQSTEPRAIPRNSASFRTDNSVTFVDGEPSEP